MFCNHKFKPGGGGFSGLLSYGRQILSGDHTNVRCVSCGEVRWKSYNWQVVSKRKTLDYPKQLTFK